MKMQFKDYLEEQIKKVDSNDNLLLLIYFDDTIQFKYHKGCFADFQEDFCILYDDEVHMTFRYDSVRIMQCADIENLKKEMADSFIEHLIKEMME